MQGPADLVVRVDRFGLAAADLLGLAGLPGLERQDRQPLEGRGVPGACRSRAVSSRRSTAPSPRRPPARPGACRSRGRVRSGRPEVCATAAQKPATSPAQRGPVSTAAPDRRVARPSPQRSDRASRRPRRTGRQDRRVRPPEPDAVVTASPFRAPPPRLDRHRRVVERQSSLRSQQGPGDRHHEARSTHGLVNPTLEPVKAGE